MDSSGHLDTTFLLGEHYLLLPITKIHLCALTNKTNQSKFKCRPPTNHWIILLEYSPFKWIKIELQPGLTGPDGRNLGVVVVNSDVVFLDLAQGEQIIHEIGLETLEKPSVKELVQRIGGGGLNRYKFTEFEEGGRYWVYRVVREWENFGLVKERSAAVVEEGLSWYYRYPDGLDERDINQGELY